MMSPTSLNTGGQPSPRPSRLPTGPQSLVAGERERLSLTKISLNVYTRQLSVVTFSSSNLTYCSAMSYIVLHHIYTTTQMILRKREA